MITIIAHNLQQEFIDVVAQQKGYQYTKIVPVEKEESFDTYIGIDWVEVPAGIRKVQVMEEVPNTQSKEDFLRQVYEWMVVNDVSTEIIRFNNKMKEEALIAEENAIREAVAQSITSTIE